ncbi:MAG TPA: monovalent cation:proton antiporter-2 (CPA2) family protein [Cellvibrio sp.]|nr:monovalent cation:proton antiporter-2 (CPA2) family protein [Cellvibrio sp.]
MEQHQSLLHAIYYLLAATIAVPIFRRWGLGAILGYLVAGAVIGPQALGLIYETESAMHLSELGVVLLLFIIGLELNPEQLWKMRGEVGLLGGAQLLLTSILIGLVLNVGFALNPQQSILIGLTLALSSTAFAVPLMEEHKLMGLPLGRKGFSILLLQDLAVIPILLLLASWAPQAAAETHLVPWWMGVLTVIGVIALGPWVFNPLLKLAAKYGSREILTAAGLLIVLGVSLLMQTVGFSMSMGAFLAGILLAQSSFRHQLAADIEPFKGLLLGLFFIAVGMSLNLKLLLAQPLLVVFLALALMAIKIAVVALILFLRKIPLKEGVLLGIMLAQGGEFAFVVMSSALEISFLPESIANFAVLVVGLSMAFTGPLVVIYQSVIRRRTAQEKALADNLKSQQALQQLQQASEAKAEVIVAGFGRFGQIIGRILTANNIPYNALDKNSDHIEFLKQFGVQSYYGDAARIELLEAAGIRDAKVLVVAVDRVDDSMNIVQLVRERFPHIALIIRARDRNHVYQLASLGVQNPVREIYESSLDAAKRTLIEIGFTEGQALSNINIFREHDEAMLQKATLVSNDKEALARIVEQGRKELKELYTQDAQL